MSTVPVPLPVPRALRARQELSANDPGHVPDTGAPVASAIVVTPSATGLPYGCYIGAAVGSKDPQ